MADGVLRAPLVVTAPETIFLYGTLCDPDLFEIVAGMPFEPEPATLEAARVVWADGQSFPLLIDAPGAKAEGVIVTVGADARARMDFYEVGFGYTTEARMAATQAGQREVTVYIPPEDVWPAGDAWSLSDWQDAHGPLSREAASEYMRLFKALPPKVAAESFAQIRMRAASRLRARASQPKDALQPSLRGRQVDMIRSTQPYTSYFAVREDDLRFPTFDGGLSEPVRRAAFMGGDAVTVLPYDPAHDRVQIVRQFRYGAFVRDDPDPWSLEPVAGRIDPGETPQEAARREMAEETGLTARALHPISAYYPSPAAFSEFLFSYVGIVDLDGADGQVSGLETEAEDIMSHVLPFDEAFAMVAGGAANTGPLVLSLLWLQANRTRLRDQD